MSILFTMRMCSRQNLILNFICIFHLITLVWGVLKIEEQPDEARLKHDLLQHYDPSVRPKYNNSLPVDVTADIALQQIIDVNEKQQLLKATVWMRVYWNDEFLVWDPKDYNGVSGLKLTPDRVWVPDICLYDALEPAIHANAMQDFFVSVLSTGDVMWLSPLVMEYVCHFNVRYFPYDTQYCSLTMGSWIYHGQEVDVFNKNDEGDTSSFKNNVEWDVKGFNVKKKVTKYGCCPESFPTLNFTLVIQRKPGFYVTYLYLPSVVIIASSLFSFYLPPGSDSKVDLAVTGLLSQTVFLLLISDLMPPDAHNPPVLGECLTILLVVQAMAVVVIVIVKRIHDDSIHKSKPPSKALYTVMHYLKYPFLLHHIDYQRSKPQHRRSTNVNNLHPPAEGNCNNGFNDEGDKEIDEITIKVENALTTHSFTNGIKKELNGIANGGVNPPNGRASLHVESLEDHKIDNDESDGEGVPAFDKRQRKTQVAIALTLNEILKEMRTVKTKRRASQHQEDIAEQWRHIAAMYDRILFVIFIIVILGITIWFVTLQPIADKQRQE